MATPNPQLPADPITRKTPAKADLLHQNALK